MARKNKDTDTPTPDALPVRESSFKRVEPDEFYKAKFIKCYVADGTYGPYARLEFKLLNGNIENTEETAKGLQMSAFCPANITKTNSAWPIMKALIGKDPTIDESLDVTPYYGKLYNVLVTDGKKVNDDGTAQQSITRIKIYKKKSTA